MGYNVTYHLFAPEEVKSICYKGVADPNHYCWRMVVTESLAQTDTESRIMGNYSDGVFLS